MPRKPVWLRAITLIGVSFCITQTSYLLHGVSEILDVKNNLYYYGSSSSAFGETVPKAEETEDFQTETELHHMKNLHENFPVKCGEQPSAVHPALEPLLHLFYNDRAAHEGKRNFNDGGHSGGRNLTQAQVCLYDVLNRWRSLAEKLDISDWAAHGGAAMGAKCFGALNPWDDDIDLTVGNCSALDALWEKSPNVTDHFPSLPTDRYSANNPWVVFDARLIEGDLILTRGGKCCPWYKLLTVQQAFLAPDGGDILGLDIECMSRVNSQRERGPKRKSSWIRHMKQRGSLDDVMFGPTKIQMMPPTIIDSYLYLRYGKQAPCRYPYSNGKSPESIPKAINSPNGSHLMIYADDIRTANMNFAVSTWYIPRSRRKAWHRRAGNGKQNELTREIPNLDEVEIDNTISPGCNWGQNASLKLIGWNAERGKYWDKFVGLIHEMDALRDPYVILLNEMDIGMARSGNVHTARRLALELGMNYAFGLEFVELTPGTEEEQNATIGKRDALGLHGNAVLSKCFIGDTAILRDSLPPGYFSNKSVKHFNANGYEVRLGGRMGLFARIFQEDPGVTWQKGESVTRTDRLELPPHFVVGNVHKVAETEANRDWLWDYYGFGTPPENTTKYDGKGVDSGQQLGVVVQGDFGPQFCSLGGLNKLNNYRVHKTFPAKCDPPKPKIGPIAGDFFCSNMQQMNRGVEVSAPCYYPEGLPPVTLSDHAIVSVTVEANSS